MTSLGRQIVCVHQERNFAAATSVQTTVFERKNATYYAMMTTTMAYGHNGSGNRRVQVELVPWGEHAFCIESIMPKKKARR